jgi:hypothetical protein
MHWILHHLGMFLCLIGLRTGIVATAIRAAAADPCRPGLAPASVIAMSMSLGDAARPPEPAI